MINFELLNFDESEHWLLRLHPNQCYLGRATIIAKREVDLTLASCTDEEYLDLRKVLQKYEKVMTYLFKPDRYNYTQLGNEWPQLHRTAILRSILRVELI